MSEEKEPDYAALSKNIDWNVFQGDSFSELECINRHVFKGYGKAEMSIRRVLSDRPCPRCGEYLLRRVSSPTEVFTIRGKS